MSSMFPAITGARITGARSVAGAIAVAVLPLAAAAAPADGVATFDDRADFDAALAALGTVSSIVATYDALTAGSVLADGTAVGGITHDYTGGDDANVDLYVRGFPAGATNTLGTLFQGTFEGPFGFDDALTVTTAMPYRAVSVDLLNSPTFDFTGDEVSLAAGGLTVDVAPGSGGGTPVATAVERRFFGIIAPTRTLTQAVVTFDIPNAPLGDLDSVSFYNVTPVTPPIPLPASLPLMLGGLAVLGVVGRRLRG